MDTIKSVLTTGFLFASVILALFLAKYLGLFQKRSSAHYLRNLFKTEMSKAFKE